MNPMGDGFGFEASSLWIHSKSKFRGKIRGWIIGQAKGFTRTFGINPMNPSLDTTWTQRRVMNWCNTWDFWWLLNNSPLWKWEWVSEDSTLWSSLPFPWPTSGYNRLFESLAPHVGASLGDGITLETNSQLAPRNRTRAPLCHQFSGGSC